MEILYFPGKEMVEAAVRDGEPLLLLIPFDGTAALVSPADEAVEHHILLDRARQAGLVSRDSRAIDRYFRAVADADGADWTFVCPAGYKGISDKGRRIAAFYRDGFAAISEALETLGIRADIEIPRRYRRHMQILGDENANL